MKLNNKISKILKKDRWEYLDQIILKGLVEILRSNNTQEIGGNT